MAFDLDEGHPARKWFFRLFSLGGIVAAIVATGMFMRRGQSFPAIMLVLGSVFFAGLAAWSWAGSLFTALARAKRYVEGVEGDHRHEWHAFKGQRVRVFLDRKQEPWFPLNEIAFILALEVDEKAFRTYGPNEVGTPDGASGKCLSESGLRRLIRYSPHRDAGALGLWLERDVLRILRNRAERDAA
jgi:hypothetical protein